MAKKGIGKENTIGLFIVVVFALLVGYCYFFVEGEEYKPVVTEAPTATHKLEGA